MTSVLEMEPIETIRPRTGLSVLSFGSTRGLWDGESAEDFRRMLGYAEHLDEYVIVANSYKRHGLRRRHLAPHVEAIPTDAHSPVDSLLRMFWIGASVLRERPISLIQAQDPLFLGLVAVLLGKLFHLPVNICLYGPNVFDEHWLASRWSNRFLAPIGQWVLRHCQGVQVDGKMTARSLVAAGIPEERIAVKPVVPTNLGGFFEIERKPHDGPPRLLYVGRFAAQKNLPVLLEAARLLQAEGRSFELDLVGEGPLKPELQNAVDETGFTGVRFHPPVSRDEIGRVFADADIFVLTSDFEGYPRVLMEAAASALPIVSTAVSGADEAIVDFETGFIVPIRDAKAVAARLVTLLDDPTLREQMGRAGREHIRTHLDPRTNTPGQVAIWKRITAPPSGPLPRHLLLFNLVTDADHPILGFTTQWIRALAARVETIDVITMQAGVLEVPENVRVHSVGKERGYSEPRRVVEFYRLLFRILREERIDGCFSHMMQIFSVLAGPVLWASRIPMVTWYAHPSLPLSVKLAHFFSDRMVTSLPGAYPWHKDKLVVIGQGIDTALFAPAPANAASNDTILCVGRISKVKEHATLLRAVALLPRRYRLVILGATSGAADEACARELHVLIAELDLEKTVVFEDPVPASQLPAHYLRCAVHVNLTPAGFGDKVAWEAMSCGRPCLVANEDFRETLGSYADELLFRVRDPQDLAVKLDALLAKTPAERDEIGSFLRAQVERLHSLPRLADRVLEQLAECQAAHA